MVTLGTFQLATDIRAIMLVAVEHCWAENVAKWLRLQGLWFVLSYFLDNQSPTVLPNGIFPHVKHVV